MRLGDTETLAVMLVGDGPSDAMKVKDSHWDEGKA